MPQHGWSRPRTAISSALSRNITTFTLLLLKRAEMQRPIASTIAKQSARKKFVVNTSSRARPEPLTRMAPEAETITSSAAIKASAAIRIHLRQKPSTAQLALAGMATAKRYAMPPSNNASQASVAARARILSRSISRRNQSKGIVLRLT